MLESPSVEVKTTLRIIAIGLTRRSPLFRSQRFHFLRKLILVCKDDRGDGLEIVDGIPGGGTWIEQSTVTGGSDLAGIIAREQKMRCAAWLQS